MKLPFDRIAAVLEGIGHAVNVAADGLEAIRPSPTLTYECISDTLRPRDIKPHDQPKRGDPREVAEVLIRHRLTTEAR
jgi:hypothetical protein